jgi:superoxide dismutase, Cu-Zn family
MTEVEMMDAEGESLGSLELRETPNGVLISGELAGLPPGAHGFHFHETGECEPPFESAGDHFDPSDADHGYMASAGPHAGDMPNQHAHDDGTLLVEVLNAEVTLAEGEPNSLRDDGGRALIIHAEPDDYESQPSGEAGDRLACGVVQ